MKFFRFKAYAAAMTCALASLLYLVAAYQLGRLPNIDNDEVHFKSAGRELAMTGRFAAPELSGFCGIDPPAQEVWLLYPPLYPLLFGGFVKLVGFGWKQCVMFDAIIKVALVALTWFVARRLSGNGERWPAFGAAVLTLVLARGVAGRPDELAMAAGMAGLLPLVRPGGGSRLECRESALSGLLFGLCAGTSIVAAIVLGCVALAFLVARAGGIHRFALVALVWCVAAGIVFAALIVPILWNHPNAYQQYFSLAQIIFQGDTRSHWGKIAALFTIGWRVTVPVVGMLALGAATVFAAVRRESLRRWATLWIGPLLGMAFILAIDPHLYTYVWFLGPYVMAAGLVSLSDSQLAPRRRLLWAGYVGSFGLLGALGSVETIRQTVVLANLPREQSIDYNDKRLRGVVPRGAVVMSHDAWWFLAGENLVYAPNVAPTYWDNVEYVVSSGFEPWGEELDAYFRAHFVKVQDDRSATPVTILNVPLSRGMCGFGMLVLARRELPATTSAKIDAKDSLTATAR